MAVMWPSENGTSCTKQTAIRLHEPIPSNSGKAVLYALSDFRSGNYHCERICGCVTAALRGVSAAVKKKASVQPVRASTAPASDRTPYRVDEELEGLATKADVELGRRHRATRR